MVTIYGLGVKGNRQHIVDYSRGQVQQGSIRWLLSFCPPPREVCAAATCRSEHCTEAIEQDEGGEAV